MKKIIILITVLFSILGCEKENDLLNLKEKMIFKKGKGLQYSKSASNSSFSYCNCNNPIGGGNGYANIIESGNKILSPYDKYRNLKTKQRLGLELKILIDNSQTDDIIFIDPICDVELQSSVTITKAITIASNRGINRSNGAKITLKDGVSNPLFIVKSSNVRISGIDFYGHYNYSTCIQAYGYNNIALNNIKIDNNEFYYWSDAVRLSEVDPKRTTYQLSKDAFYIHNNSFHHNIYGYPSGRGYGIMVYKAFANIYANEFYYNRHDIAGVGSPKSGFNLYCNKFGNQSTHNQSNVDMHGDHGNKENYAGSFMHIHHNVFEGINHQANIFPVGRPTTLCLINNNKFATGTIYSNLGNCAIAQNPYKQKNSSSLYGNVIAVNNIYKNSYLGWYVREQWDQNMIDNFIRIPSSNDLLHSNKNANISGKWIDKNNQDLDYYFGDFNGDGNTDIFMSDGVSWYWLPLDTEYTNNWNLIATSNVKIGTMESYGNDYYKYHPNLIFDNFDNDNFTDIFTTTGSSWLVSYGNNPGWNRWVKSSATIGKLLFGKFHNNSYNDKITDVLFPNGSVWKISFDGSSWKNYKQAYPYEYNRLRTGDFNGNGTTDVFYTNQNSWYYQDNGTTYSWNKLAKSQLHADFLEIADFNSDNRSDVIGFVDNKWKVSFSAKSSWKILNTLNFPLSGFQYGDLK